MSLIFSNKKTQDTWTMNYRDYVTPNVQADGAMIITRWSKNSEYAYFTTTLGGSGGSHCHYEGVHDFGVGLFQVNLQTGQTKEILPLIKDHVVYYNFFFSPSDRWFIYGIRGLGLVSVDRTTGQQTDILHEEDYDDRGGYIWSPDSSKFVYTTESYNGIDEYIATLRLVDVQTGEEKILFETDRNCYWATKWEKDDVLFVNYFDFDKNGDIGIMKYDLNSNIIVDPPLPPN